MKTEKKESVTDSIRNSPKNSDKNNTRITVKLTDKTDEMLTEIENKTQMPRSSIVRYAITTLHRAIIENGGML